MELIINNPCPEKRRRQLDADYERRGRKSNLDTTLYVMGLETDTLYLFTQIDLALEPDLAQKIDVLPSPHSQRLRGQLQANEQGPDAFLIRNYGKHRQFCAWWGQTLQNQISDVAYLRGMDAIHKSNANSNRNNRKDGISVMNS